MGAALWGFSGACAQFLLTNYDITPSVVTAVRMLGAGRAVPAGAGRAQPGQLAAMLHDRSSAARLVVFGAMGLFLCQITYAVVIGYTNAGTATVLQSTGIAFVMLFSCVFARKLPRGREFVGLVAAMAATWLIATQGDPGVLSMPLAGLLWGIANGLSGGVLHHVPRSACSRAGAASP